MGANDMVLVQGMADTKRTLRAWNATPGRVLRGWLVASIATAVGLLFAVLVVARLATPDPSPIRLAAVTSAGNLDDVAAHLYRNCLVLALHAMACVAGFIAGSSLPQLARERHGLSRIVHERAGPLAIAFVVGATAFSLATQAFVLGSAAATVAWHLHIGPATLLLGLLPHALPELTALFLPLAAWVIASRRGEWNELLAATFVTVGVALPVLVVSSLIEVYVSPHLIGLLIR